MSGEPSLQELLYGPPKGQPAGRQPLQWIVTDQVKFFDIRDNAYGGSEGFFHVMRAFGAGRAADYLEPLYYEWLRSHPDVR